MLKFCGFYDVKHGHPPTGMSGTAARKAKGFVMFLSGINDHQENAFLLIWATVIARTLNVFV
jgi:hypothetical protein